MWPAPPPCPVDDAPHTTCTSADYVPRAPIVIVQLPCRDAGLAAEAQAAALASAAAGPSTSFSTATYRRALHGRRPK
jgi:hypothetical protein